MSRPTGQQFSATAGEVCGRSLLPADSRGHIVIRDREALQSIARQDVMSNEELAFRLLSCAEKGSRKKPEKGGSVRF